MKKWDVFEEEKIEKENSRVRDFLTRSLPKKAAAVGLAAMLALGTLTFGGCGNTKGGGSNTPNAPETSQVQQTEKEETTGGSEVIQKPIVEDTKDPSGDEKNEVPVSTIEGFVENLRQNFACTVTENGVQTNYVVDDGVVKVEKADATTIYTSDETGHYVYSLLEDGKWEKNFAETQFNQDAILYDVLSRTTWSAYDENTNTFTGTVDGQQLSLKIDGSNATISGDALNASVSEVGSAAISAPVEDNVVDKTIPQEYIYQNGDYNLVLIKEVLEDWMKGNNQWGKDVLAQKRGKDTYKTDKIIYINPTDEVLNIGLIMYRADVPYYYECYINDQYFSVNNQTFVQNISSGQISTEEDLKEYLNAMSSDTLQLTETQVQIDTAVTEAEFETMTENVFKKLTNKGTQNDISEDSPETKVENFDQSEVIYAFKGTPSYEAAGCGLGYKRNWKQYYIVEVDGKVEFVEIEVISSTYNNVSNEKENVINDTEGWWLVFSIIREEIDRENKQIHESANVQALSQTTTSNSISEEINREL